VKSVIAVCVDDPAPVTGAEFATCTAVEWREVWTGLELEEVQILVPAIATLLAIAFVWKVLRKSF